jgi:GTP-binding protein EngB required for normal cell division/DNA-binding XRE family transcriptional regulator
MDLKSFRENKLKMTTEAFAKIIDVKKSDLLEMEKDENKITVTILQKIASKTGLRFEDIIGYKKPEPKPINSANMWKKPDFTKRNLVDYIRTSLDKYNISNRIQNAYVNDLNTGINGLIKKPLVLFVGRSDAGKSTMINALLGVEKMPTSWTPTTSIAVYIKHASDRPSFIKDDVWIFANKRGNASMWDVSRIQDQEYCLSWKIGSGDVTMLKSFGTRQGDKYKENAGSAVVFVDSPILNNCDIIDIPGYGTENSNDDIIKNDVTQVADVIIYLSQATNFMQIGDINYLKDNISRLDVIEKRNENSLNPFSNLFIVASQAQNVDHGNVENIKTILDTQCDALVNTLPDKYFKTREQLSGYKYKTANARQELRARFFAYTTDIPDLCEPFNNDLTALLESLPSIIDEKAKNFVREYTKNRKPNLSAEIKKYEGIIKEHDKYIALLSSIEENEPERAYNNSQRNKELLDFIRSCKNESRAEFINYFALNINKDAIKKFIKERKVKNKKEDVEQFGSWLQSDLQSHCEGILRLKSENLKNKTTDYVKAFSDGISTSFDSNNVKIDFDAGWEFTKSLAKFGVFGGLGSFILGISSFAIGSAAFVAGVGGTIALISAGLGPIGVAVGVLTAAVLGVIRLFGGGWEQSIAKKIVEAYEKEDVNGKFLKGIDKYWGDTEKAFNHAASDLENEWLRYVEDLRQTVDSYDMDDLQLNLSTLRTIEDFFENIPL